MAREARQCRKCGRLLPIGEFHKRGRGHQSVCKKCNVAAPQKGKRSTRKQVKNPQVGVPVAKPRVKSKGADLVERSLEAERRWLQDGETLAEIAAGLKLPSRAVSRMIAEKVKLDPHDVRDWLNVELVDLYTLQKAEGYLADARQTLGDIGRLNGLISTGGNVFVGIRGGSGSKVDVRVTVGEEMSRLVGELPAGERAELMAAVQADVVEGEVVE